MFLNSKKQGDWGLGIAIAYFTSLGKTVAIPLTDSQDYDLVVETKAKKLLKIQVKTTTYKTSYGIYMAGLKTCGGNRSGQTIKLFNPNLTDYVFIATSDNSYYLIPSKKIDNTATINLGNKYKKYKISC